MTPSSSHSPSDASTARPAVPALPKGPPVRQGEQGRRVLPGEETMEK